MLNLAGKRFVIGIQLHAGAFMDMLKMPGKPQPEAHG
jgi:hypothetical protein